MLSIYIFIICMNNVVFNLLQKDITSLIRNHTSYFGLRNYHIIHRLANPSSTCVNPAWFGVEIFQVVPTAVEGSVVCGNHTIKERCHCVILFQNIFSSYSQPEISLIPPKKFISSHPHQTQKSCPPPSLDLFCDPISLVQHPSRHTFQATSPAILPPKSPQ